MHRVPASRWSDLLAAVFTAYSAVTFGAAAMAVTRTPWLAPTLLAFALATAWAAVGLRTRRRWSWRAVAAAGVIGILHAVLLVLLGALGPALQHGDAATSGATGWGVLCALVAWYARRRSGHVNGRTPDGSPA